MQCLRVWFTIWLCAFSVNHSVASPVDTLNVDNKTVGVSVNFDLQLVWLHDFNLLMRSFTSINRLKTCIQHNPSLTMVWIMKNLNSFIHVKVSVNPIHLTTYTRIQYAIAQRRTWNYAHLFADSYKCKFCQCSCILFHQKVIRKSA